MDTAACCSPRDPSRASPQRLGSKRSIPTTFGPEAESDGRETPFSAQPKDQSWLWREAELFDPAGIPIIGSSRSRHATFGSHPRIPEGCGS
ncbi:hypothetical protein EPK99_04085 [Neorhizobium lilium]|uniref:Uncharacterized protein n=1 Tax=Neorhizobium lilium TaxID=2503024 RepID=A0A3S3RLM5_9HYPH|nr:hypothetical protein EPK99_04085 [Neorhizobium lilium]